MESIPGPLQAALADRYSVTGVVGRGGMAIVYLAHDLRHDRDVALKVLRPDLAATIGPDRFLTEIAISARLNHPHILTLIDSGAAASFLYYVMPFIEGESLRSRLNREGRIPLAATLAIVEDVADALDYAHRQGVFHRDIKPENVLLSEGHAIVADFGIAKALSTAGARQLTRTGFPLGTPGYMSPEQAAGMQDLDGRTDVYSLACVCYEMLVGEPPRRWLTEEDVGRGRFLGAPPTHRAALDRLPGGVEAALVRALILRPELRTPGPGAFLAEARKGDAAASPAGLPRSYKDSEVRDIMRRAAEAEAAANGAEAGITLGGLREIASEAGIPTEFVRRAVRESDDRAGLPSGRPSWFLGAHTAIGIERVVDGELPDRELPELLEEIRSTLGVQGYVSQSGRSFTWRTRRPTPARGEGASRAESIDQAVQHALDDDAPEIQVRIIRRRGRIHIRVERQLKELAAGIFGGIMGGAGAGGIAVALGVGIGVFDAVAAGLLLSGAVVAGTHALARTIFRALRRRYVEQLTGLADRLAADVADTAIVGRPERERREVAT